MIAGLAERLEAARIGARLAALTPADGVASVDEAYRIQAELIVRANSDVRGWKVTALAPADQAMYRSSRPVAGPLLGPYVHTAPAQASLSALVAPLLECEVAFVLGRDLPHRDEPYDRAEVEAAIAAVVPVFELADLRVEPKAPALLKLADAMGNGLFIVGQPISDWRRLDLTNIAIALSHDGEVIDNGSSARILGDPLLAVVALADAQPLPDPGLRAGQIVTTGTCTTPIAVRIGAYAADFGALGRVGMKVVA